LDAPGKAAAGPRAVGTRSASWTAGLRAVAGRELASAFDSNVAYVATIAGLLAVASAFMNEFFLSGKLDMTPFFDALAPALVLLMPAIAMRTWSEDLATRTFELWTTLPLSSAQLVLGKYLAALALYLVFLAGTLPIVAMLCALGDPDLGRIASGYLGAVLLGALLLAIGQLVSGLSADQIVVFLATAFVAFALLGCGHPRVVAVLDGVAEGLGTALHDRVSALPHYARFVRGTVAASSLAYFGGLSALCLALNARAVRALRT